MTAEKFLQGHICLDGKPVHNVAGNCRRAVTVETEAITIE